MSKVQQKQQDNKQFGSPMGGIPAEKAKALESALARIEKEFGKGAVMMFGQKTSAQVETISTGSLLINKALGIGGFPRGRIIEIYGPEASGKTTITLHAIAAVQRSGGICAFIDAEHAMDPKYAEQVGININQLLISQPDSGEDALNITESLVTSGAIDLIVIDSVAALVPKSELAGEMGDQHVGLQARLMSQALRKLTPVVNKSRAIVIFINQIRNKIGGLPFASNETTTGGNALKYYSSVRLDVRRISSIKKDDVAIGNRVAVKVVKNKLAPPFSKTEVDLFFGKGILKESELFDMALSAGVFEQSGAWFSYKNQKIAQGKDSCIKRLQEPTFFEEIYNQVTIQPDSSISDLSKEHKSDE